MKEMIQHDQKNCSQIPPSIIEAAAKSDLDLKIAYTKSEDGKNLKNIAKSILNSYMNKSYYFAFSIDVGKYNLTSEKVVYDLLQYGWNGYQFPFSYREKKYKVNNFIRYTYIDADGIYLDNIKLDKWGYISTGRIEPETALLLKGKNDNVKDSYFVLLFSITAFDTAIYNWGGLPRRGSIIIGKLHKIGILSNVKISDIGEYRPQIIYEEQYK